jgi:aspartate kinase
MATKVSKFGGSSLCDAQQLRKVQRLVQSDPARRFVVPSAPGKRWPDDEKVTDLLYRCQALAARREGSGEVFAQIARRYREIHSELALVLDLESELKEIHARIEGGATPDYAASRGEYLCGKLVAELLGYVFVDAAEIIHFDASGRFDSERTQTSCAARLGATERAVVPGFYGSNPDGSIRTFSRGGSDVTGAIVARGASADVYENWTDVSGILMADPRVVRDPKPIELLTYRELRELAYMGATVLHDEAIFPVRAAGIPVHILNTNAPEDPGTRIVRSTGDAPPTSSITGIAGRKDFAIIAVEKTLMNAEVGFGRKMLQVLEAHGIPFEHLPSGIDTMSLVVRQSFIEGKLADVCEGIRRECKPDALEVYRNMALIATVGRGMMHTPGMASRLFAALADASVNVRMIDQGSSELNIIVGVEAADFETAVRAIYTAFV